MAKTERAAFIAQNDTAAFRARIEAIKLEQKKESDARCRVSAVTFEQKGVCSVDGTLVTQPVFDASVKCTAVPDAKFQCPQQITTVDNGCRRRASGEIVLYPVNMAPGTFVASLAETPSCAVARTQKDVSADVKYLQSLYSQRTAPQYRNEYTHDVSIQMALLIANTLGNAELLQSLFASAEEDIDRSQQYAFKNLVRLMQFVRARKELITLTKAKEREAYPQAVKAAVQQVVSQSAAVLRANSDKNVQALRAAMDAFDGAVRGMVPSGNIGTGPVFELRVNMEKLRKVLQ